MPFFENVQDGGIDGLIDSAAGLAEAVGENSGDVKTGVQQHSLNQQQVVIY